MESILIASGPVIIEDHKVLLNKAKKDGVIGPWMFPGGKVENLDLDLRTACIREAKEELGIDVTIIKPLDTLLIKRPNGPGHAVLVHYLATRSGEPQCLDTTVEYAWHDMSDLPQDCAQNVYDIIETLL